MRHCTRIRQFSDHSTTMFDVTEITIAEYHQALVEQQTTCEEVIVSYLERINALDGKLRSFIHLNPNCRETARKLDESHRSNPTSKLPVLFGVPIILKDTFATTDIPTTAGSKSLRGLKSHDAFVVTKLREAGAVIIGKGNVHEFSLHGCTFSSLGGQTLNPYDLTRTPGGSSGGSAAAVAANLTMLGTGGDTMNSIRSPSSACNLVGLRPTMGQISRAGIVPVAMSQDAIGPIGRSVQDVRLLFEVMRGEDLDDISTMVPNRNASRHVPEGKKVRIGLLRSYFPERASSGEGRIVQQVMDEALGKLSGMATLVDVDERTLSVDIDMPTLINDVDVQGFEMKTAFDEFLSSKYILATPHKTLDSIAASGDYDENALTPAFHNTLMPDNDTNSADYHLRRRKMDILYKSLQQLLKDQNLDAITFPHQRLLVMEVGTRSQLGRNGILASLTGCPSLCIPGMCQIL